MADHPVAGEETFEVEEEEFLERQEAVLAGGRLQADEAGDLLGDGQERLEVAFVGFALELEREREARVRDEGEGMRGVDGERRQDREDLAQEDVVELAAVFFGELVAGEEGDARGFEVGLELAPGDELLGHEAAGVLVDEDELFGGGQAIDGGGGVARVGEFAEAGDADGVEFVEVGGGDRHEPDAFEQGDAGVRRLFEDAPVEREPGEFAVEEALRPLAFGVGDGDGVREGGREEIRWRHEGLVSRNCEGSMTDHAPPVSGLSRRRWASARVTGRPSERAARSRRSTMAWAAAKARSIRGTR